MIREIKYRQRIGNEYHYWGLINGEWINPAALSNGQNQANTTHEQYTELKDKNGVEIYEGDIVAALHGDPRPCLVVVYQAPSFVLKNKPHHKMWQTFILPPDQNQFFEVIGNIHENFELLEEAA